MKKPAEPAPKTVPPVEYLYAVVGDLWGTLRIDRVRLLKRTATMCKVERGAATGYNTNISYDDARRRGIVGSARVAVIEWRARLKKQRDALIDELAQIEKVLAGPDPKENF